MSESEVKTLKWLLRTVVIALITNAIVVGYGIWWASDINTRVSHLEEDETEIIENMIDPMAWKYNDYFTRYLWAERWNQTLPNPPYNTRGGVPNL